MWRRWHIPVYSPRRQHAHARTPSVSHITYTPSVEGDAIQPLHEGEPNFRPTLKVRQLYSQRDTVPAGGARAAVQRGYLQYSGGL